MFRIICICTLNGLLEALKRRGGGVLIFISSGGTIYGKLRQIPVGEDHPLEPITPYGISKLAAEKYLQYYRLMHNVDTRVVRLANPYGAGQNLNKPQGAVSTFIDYALANKLIEIWGDGQVCRDFIYITDVISAMIKIMNLIADVTAPMPVYNIGSGTKHSLNDVIAFIEEAIRKPYHG